MFDGKEYNKCNEISSNSNDELLMKFKSIVENIVNKNGCVMNYIYDRSGDPHFSKFYKETETTNPYCLRFVPFAGSGSTSNTKINFYELINKNTLIYGYYNDLINNNKFKMYIPFDNKQEIINFINYTQTIFCMGCLYLKKNSLNLYADETSLIPWFNFNDSIFSKSPDEIDDYLFTKYNISNEIRKHIEKLLPDYNIRKGRD